MKIKLLTMYQLIGLAVCAFGIQFANSLQMANMSSVYKFLGVSSEELPYLWLAAPITGLLIQSIIGQLSDDTFTRYGKRRPYLLFWGLVAFLCFILLPIVNHLWVVAILFWGISCSVNGLTEALRALVGDITPNQQKADAFSWQTIFSCLGAAIAAALPWLLERNLFIAIFPNHNHIPIAIKPAFILGGMILLTCMSWTVYQIRERPAAHISVLNKYRSQYKKKLGKKIQRFILQIIISIKKMPIIIHQFILVQIFTWIGIFSMWLYFSLNISQQIYGLPPGIDITEDQHYLSLLEQGSLTAGVYFGLFQMVSAFYAMLLPLLAERVSPRFIHAVSLIIGAMGLINMGFTHTRYFTLLNITLIGIMWGSIMTLPYAIVSAELPRSKMGIYLGIFNITITLPQIIVGLFLGPLYTNIFHSHAAYTMVFAGVSILLAGIILLKQVLPNK